MLAEDLICKGLFIGLSLMALIPSLIGGCAREEPERTIIRPVRAVKVADFEGFQQRGFPGRAQATQENDLAFRAPRPLVTRPVNVGDEVKEGDVVARISRDSASFDRSTAGNTW